MVGDFRDTWNSLCWNPMARSRGNFLFGSFTMVMLEWSSRLAASDPTRQALARLSNQLAAIEPRYFTPLPNRCADPRDFELPAFGQNPQAQLLWAIFDLIRNGQAHQYQQIIVTLTDGRNFAIGLSGTRFGRWLWRPELPSHANRHLAFRTDARGNVLLIVRPDQFFRHLTTAVERSGLLTAGLSFNYLQRPRNTSPPKPRGKDRGPLYDFDSLSLVSALTGGGHPCI